MPLLHTSHYDQIHTAFQCLTAHTQDLEIRAKDNTVVVVPREPIMVFSKLLRTLLTDSSGPHLVLMPDCSPKSIIHLASVLASGKIEMKGREDVVLDLVRTASAFGIDITNVDIVTKSDKKEDEFSEMRLTENYISKKIVKEPKVMVKRLRRFADLVTDITCDICSKNMRSRSEAITHIRMQHENICDILSETRRVLDKDVEEDVNEITEIAPIIRIASVRSINDIVHVEQELDNCVGYEDIVDHEDKGGENMIYKCSLCGYRPVFLYSLWMHIMKDHFRQQIKEEFRHLIVGTSSGNTCSLCLASIRIGPMTALRHIGIGHGKLNTILAREGLPILSREGLPQLQERKPTVPVRSRRQE